MADDWYDKKWSKRIFIETNPAAISAENPIKNFISVVAKTLPKLAKIAQDSGNDILFTADDGKTKLDHEIQKWDAKTGRLVAWVKIPIIYPNKKTRIYLYYGNPDSSNQENSDGLWSDYEFRQNFLHDPYDSKSDEQNIVKDNTGTPLITQFFTAQINILEELFPNDWFKNADRKIKKHPAFKRWKICHDILTNNGKIKLAGKNDSLVEIAKILLDNLSLIQITNGNIELFTTNSLSNYGDESVRNRIKSEIIHPRKFHDILTELQYAGWCQAKNYKVYAYEVEGADLKIKIPNWDRPIITECKRIQKETNISRINDVIKKANRQIKKIDKNSYGLAVIDLSEKIKKTTHEKLSDEFPNELDEFKNKALSSIKNYNTSVSGVLLTWKHIHVMGKFRKGALLKIVLRNFSKFLHHRSPKYSINNPKEIKIVGTISFNVWL